MRQASFCLHFDCNGKLQPVKLNKHHALVIVAPVPPDLSSKFPHVLDNVLSTVIIPNSLPEVVKETLKLPIEYTEVELVAAVWNLLYFMMNILKEE